jgi:trigger factor
VDIPDALINVQYNYLIRNIEMSLRYQGLDLDSFITYTGSTRDSFEDSMRARARREVATQLVVERIGEVEKIEASQDEVDKEIEGMAERKGKTADEYREQLKEDDIDSIKHNVIYKKTVDFLVANAVKK